MADGALWWDSGFVQTDLADPSEARAQLGKDARRPRSALGGRQPGAFGEPGEGAEAVGGCRGTGRGKSQWTNRTASG